MEDELAIIENDYCVIKRGIVSISDDEGLDVFDFQMVPHYYRNLDEAHIGIETYLALLMLDHLVIFNPKEMHNINLIGVIPIFSMVIKHIHKNKEITYEAIVIEQFNFED